MNFLSIYSHTRPAQRSQPTPTLLSQSRVYACLGVTGHLRFGQNGRGLLRATVVTRGGGGGRTLNKTVSVHPPTPYPSVPITCDFTSKSKYLLYPSPFSLSDFFFPMFFPLSRSMIIVWVHLSARTKGAPLNILCILIFNPFSSLHCSWPTFSLISSSSPATGPLVLSYPSSSAVLSKKQGRREMNCRTFSPNPRTQGKSQQQCLHPTRPSVIDSCSFSPPSSLLLI